MGTARIKTEEIRQPHSSTDGWVCSLIPLCLLKSKVLPAGVRSMTGVLQYWPFLGFSVSSEG